MWSLIQTLGATLRFLAPAALLTLLCGRDSPIMRLLQHCDKTVRSIFFPSPNMAEGVLKWLQETLPGDSRTSSLDSVWEEGSVLCDVIESVVPGSCEGHEDGMDIGHAQRLAEQYLGVTPIFSKVDLSQKSLSTYQECRLTHYLCCVRDAINRMNPPVSRTGSPLLNAQAYTLDYVARGMGLATASKNKKATFYIYPTAQQGLDPSDISLQIKGPGNCYGSIVVPVIYGKAHIIRNVFLNLSNRQNFIPVPLPIAQGASYMRTYDKLNVHKSYFVPKIKNDIDVSIVIRHDRVKVCFIPTVDGCHELSLISKGCHLIGSPFTVNVEVRSIEKQESIDSLDDDIVIETIPKPERKVVFRIVDFVTEKMILTEDGRLERISNEDADALIQTKGSIEDLTNKYRLLSCNSPTQRPDLIEEYKNDLHDNSVTILKPSEMKHNFKAIVKRVVIILRVCKEFQYKISLKKTKNLGKKILTPTPDIVNFTKNDGITKNNSNMDKQPVRESAKDLRLKFKSKLSSFSTTAGNNETSTKIDYVPNINRGKESPCIENNACELYQVGSSIEIIVSSFEDDENLFVPSLPPVEILPMLEELPERPKTPVIKILADADNDMDSSTFNEFELYKLDDQIFNSLDGFLDSYCPETDTALNISLLPVTDNLLIDGRISPSIEFHIGEPVTPTRVLHTPIPLEPDMDSIILASNLEEALVKYDMKVQKHREIEQNQSEDSGSSTFATPLRQTPFEQMTDSEILKMYEEPLPHQDFHERNQSEVKYKNDISINLGENSTHDFNVEKGGVSIRRLIKINESTDTQESIESDSEIESPVRSQYNSSEIWDSAYISIDEVNSFPDSNKTSSSNGNSPRGKLFCIEENEQEYKQAIIIDNNPVKNTILINQTGPAEYEMWKSIKHNDNQENEPIKLEDKLSKHFNKRKNSDAEFTNLIGETVNYFSQHTLDQSKNIKNRCSKTILDDEKKGSLTFFEKSAAASKSEKLYNKNYILRSQGFHKNKERPLNTLTVNDDSASDTKADMNLSTEAAILKSLEKGVVVNNKLFSSFQISNNESNFGNQKIINSCKEQINQYITSKGQECLTEKRNNKNHNKHRDEGKNTNAKKLVLSKLMTEKKDYWDNKIKTSQNAEDKKNRALSRKSSPLIKRNDSLSKKRGRQVLAKLPSVTDKWKTTFEPKTKITNENEYFQTASSHNSLVACWKEYWNDKVEKTKSIENDCNISQKIINVSHEYIRPTKHNKGFSINEKAWENKNNFRTETGNFLGEINSGDDCFPALTSSNELYKNMTKNKTVCNKYEPTPINLNKLTERIDSFLDSISSPLPIVDIETPRFSTPETPFCGIVSNKINPCDKNNNETEKFNDSDGLQIDEDILTSCVKTSNRILNGPSPDLILLEYDEEFKSNKEKSRIILPEETCRDIKEKNILEYENTHLYKTVSEIKAKIEVLSERFASDAREKFIKHKSKTMDLTHTEKVKKLKKYYSLDKIDREEVNVTDKRKKIKDNFFVNYDFNKNSEEDTTINLDESIDIPTLSERKERIEKHLQILQQRQNPSAEPKLKPVLQEKISDYSCQKGKSPDEIISKKVTDNNENVEDIQIFKPVGDIVAVFENRVSNSEFKRDAFRENAWKVEFKTSITAEECDETFKSDAENGEGTQKSNPKASLSAISNNVPSTKWNPAELQLKDKIQDYAKPLPSPKFPSDKISDLINSNLKEDQNDTHKYKQRFLKAKNFFQNLDEQHKTKTIILKNDKRLNECEKLLKELSRTEPNIPKENLNNVLENKSQPMVKGRKRPTIKAFSAPTSDTECELRRNSWARASAGKLIKISEKFQIEGLFEDVAGKSNQTAIGSFKGIPHKNAVLATFRSMENLSQLSSYEYTVSQMEDFAKKNGIVNAQTYLSDFPYLPTTAPDKYRARYDAVASGLIQRKDLLQVQKNRRNSAPVKSEIMLGLMTSV